ncbi:uncharacterized protein [Amphiura filiformis]|uniref:uncharacterized protein n=1 Tax=Amphiura filiformis TaxID=82378 RepID=UPI003B2213C1
MANFLDIFWHVGYITAIFVTAFFYLVSCEDYLECTCNCERLPNPADGRTIPTECTLPKQPKLVTFRIQPIPDECYYYQSYNSPWFDDFGNSWFHNFGIPWCDQVQDQSYNQYWCSIDLQECCWFGDFDDNTLNCRVGYHSECSELCLRGPDRCQSFCAPAILRSCVCNEYRSSTTEVPSSSTSPTKQLSTESSDSIKSSSSQTSNFAIGVGAGVGICVILAIVVGLLIYCRIQGRKEGRKRAESRLNVLEMPTRNDDLEEYAEITDHTYAGERTLQATGTVNPAYSSTLDDKTGPHSYQTLEKPDQSSSAHQYKSLKKPNQDFGSSEYADPDKYTEPPTLPDRNLTLKIEEKDENLDEDYVSQGTPDATTGDEERDYFTLDPSNPSHDDDDEIEENQFQNKDYFILDPSTKTSDDTMDVDASSADAKKKSNSSDYVDVDAPDSATNGDDNDGKSKAKSSDYVDVDAP